MYDVYASVFSPDSFPYAESYAMHRAEVFLHGFHRSHEIGSLKKSAGPLCLYLNLQCREEL